MINRASCELCASPTGDVVYRDEKLHILLVDDPNYPGFCRVIWNDHVKEMTDLSPEDRVFFMNVVWQVEIAVREVMQPDKMNTASLGNMVPHLHWHVIPRYVDDAHFPSPIWAETHRTPPLAELASRKALLPTLREAIVQHMGQFF
jgi:diadenosine tetraphosphate (Ap4A) HIT family hydrolase